MLFKYILILPVLLLLASACSYKKAEQEAPAVNVMQQGEKFRINLPETHTDGYAWTMKGNYDQKVLSFLNSVWHGPEKGVDFNYEGLQTGTTQLHFYKIGYQDTLAEKSFIISVK